MNIIRLFPESQSTSLFELKRVAEVIRGGGIVIIPTDTVYGMACDATNEEAVARVFKYKQRVATKPLSIFVSSLDHARSYAQFDPAGECFLEKVWPGPVTAVLNKKNYPSGGQETLPPIADNLAAGKNTIGFRNVDYQFIKDLFGNLRIPLVATSANISGRPAENTLGAAVRQFSKDVKFDLLIDGGTLPKSDTSTIIDISKIARPYIIRGSEKDGQRLLSVVRDCRKKE